jgi:hypothetical protein
MYGADITVGSVTLLIGWISGRSLPDIADVHLQAAPQAAWRIEQMVGTITEQFEHYLSWTVGALVELVNGLLADADSEVRLCPELGGYIRYGVNTPHALQLMTSGIRSRRLAHAVVADIPSELEPTYDDLRSWLAGMGIAEWRERYQASASEVLDLLDFTRLRNRSLLTTLLETGAASVNLPPLIGGGRGSKRSLSLELVRDEPPPEPLAIYAGQQLVAIIAAEDHADVQAILDTGLDLVLDLDDQTEPAVLRISLPLGDGDV